MLNCSVHTNFTFLSERLLLTLIIMVSLVSDVLRLTLLFQFSCVVLDCQEIDAGLVKLCWQ